SRIVLDYRDLGDKVIANHLNEAMRAQMVTAVSDFTASILSSGQWHPKALRAAESRKQEERLQPRGGRLAGAGRPQPYRNDRDDRERCGDHVDHRSLVGAEQVS